MHHAGHGALVGQVVALRDGKCVKVRAESDGLAGLRSVNDAHHGGAGDPLGDLNAELGQFFFDIGLGTGLLKAQFRVHVQIMAVFADRFALFRRQLFDHFLCHTLFLLMVPGAYKRRTAVSRRPHTLF